MFSRRLHGFGKVSPEVGLRFHFWPLAMVDIHRLITKSVLFVALQVCSVNSCVLVVVPKYQCWIVACWIALLWFMLIIYIYINWKKNREWRKEYQPSLAAVFEVRERRLSLSKVQEKTSRNKAVKKKILCVLIIIIQYEIICCIKFGFQHVSTYLRKIECCWWFQLVCQDREFAQYCFIATYFDL